MKKNHNIIRALQQCELFKHLPEDELDVIGNKAKMRQFFPDEVIVWQGNPSDSLFLITNGIVAVKRIINENEEQVLNYLMAGNTFGEIGILENKPRSATVAALSDVDVVVIRRADFIDILHQFPSVAIELAKMLGRYLVDSNRRRSRGNANVKLILLFDVFGSLGATSFGVSLARLLYQRTKNKTVYTEYPVPQKLIADLHISRKEKVYKHPGGFDILLSQEERLLTDKVRTTMMLDTLINDYENIIITLNENIDEDHDGNVDQDIAMMLDYAKQIIMFSPPEPSVWGHLEEIQRKLRKRIRTNETNIFTLINHCSEEYKDAVFPYQVDFQLPFLPVFPPLRDMHAKEVAIPEPLLDIFSTLADRLERTNNIAMYIPTTIDVDKQIDTTIYVEKTLNFFGARFGGATSKQAQGVWNSEQMGLVGETVYIVNSYVTQADLNKFLDEIIEYVKTIKVELKQEAMALEVNQKLTLI
ncbi:MAG: cyclic nucleotide-binding domain-containing protein [Thermoflexibacter sp.]|jgi:CRP-like cAMP-binding protein|nr:cyclic nucleotide-binding domain-containing protein [Thermoflexibacter sp.]